LAGPFPVVDVVIAFSDRHQDAKSPNPIGLLHVSTASGSLNWLHSIV